MPSQTPYVSCIKIGGAPILPPLITPALKNEILAYKRKAIEIERKIEERKKPYEIGKPPPPSAAVAAQSTTLENQLTFIDDQRIPTAAVAAATLTQETIDVSQYNDSGGGVQLIHHHNSDDELMLRPDNVSTPRRCRLIRSNSYVLDGPSPILLAHLQERENGGGCSDNKTKLWSSLDNGSAAVGLVTSQIDTPPTFDGTPQTFDGTPQLADILVDLPDNCSRKILNIISKQKKECDQLRQSYETLKNQLVIDSDNNNLCCLKDSGGARLLSGGGDDDDDLNTLTFGEKTPRSVSISSTQSLYYTITNTPLSNDLSLTSPPPTLLYNSPVGDGGGKDSSDENLGVDQVVVNGLLIMGEMSKESHKCLENYNHCKNVFPDLEINREQKLDWAAKIIGAHVKGYLTRRLMRTEKIELYIQTINEAAMCALQLEHIPNIDVSDVELHRRLMHQITSACCAIHDTFFSLSTADQMRLIATDRHNRMEKAKRPLSASMSSSRSSVRSTLSKSTSKKVGGDYVKLNGAT